MIERDDGGERSPTMSVGEAVEKIKAEASKFPIGSPEFAAFSDTSEVVVALASAEEDLARLQTGGFELGWRARLEQQIRLSEGLAVQLETTRAIQAGRWPRYGAAMYDFEILYAELKAVFMQEGLEPIPAAVQSADRFRGIRNDLLSPPAVAVQNPSV